MAQSDISNLEWESIKAVLPNKTRGKQRVDDRRVINGIFYVLHAESPALRPAHRYRRGNGPSQPENYTARDCAGIGTNAGTQSLESGAVASVFAK